MTTTIQMIYLNSKSKVSIRIKKKPKLESCCATIKGNNDEWGNVGKKQVRKIFVKLPEDAIESRSKLNERMFSIFLCLC